MQSLTMIVLAALVAVALAGGQYYVPRAYYTIDDQGHASPPVPLRRLRRSFSPYPYGNMGLADASASASANAQANSWGAGGASANANANADARSNGGWGLPSSGGYGASNPALGAGQTRRQAGPVVGGRYVSASSSVGLDSLGAGYYDQHTSVSN